MSHRRPHISHAVAPAGLGERPYEIIHKASDAKSRHNAKRIRRRSGGAEQDEAVAQRSNPRLAKAAALIGIAAHVATVFVSLASGLVAPLAGVLFLLAG